MNDLNNVSIEGNLVKDPEGRQTPNGTDVAILTVAVKRRYRSGEAYREDVLFVEVEGRNGLPRVCVEHLKKGQKVRVFGWLAQDRWTDADGNNRSKIKIVGESVDFGKVPERSEE